MDKLNLKPGTFSPLKIQMRSTDSDGLMSPVSPKKRKNNRFLPSNAQKVKKAEKLKVRQQEIKDGLRKEDDPISDVSSDDCDEMADMFDEMIDLVEEWGSFFEQDKKVEVKPEEKSPWIPFWDCFNDPKRYD
jgi:hypothetical protein